MSEFSRNYRYVRLRWRILFSVVDFLGAAIFGLARRIASWRRHPTPGTSAGAEPTASADEPRSILIVQLDHLGDAIITTVMLPLLRERFPLASIEVLAGAWNREVFEANPDVDRVHVSRVNRFARHGRIPGAWPLAMLWWGLRLRRRQFDLAIDVRGDFPVAMILWLCGARRRVGWACGGGGFLLTDVAPYVPNRPEVESRLALLAAMGIRSPEGARPVFWPSEGARRRMRDDGGGEAAEDGIVAFGIASPIPNPQSLIPPSSPAPGKPGRYTTRSTPAPSPLLLLHLGAGTPAKQWPAEHWQELLGRLVSQRSAEVVLVGSPADRIIAHRVLGDRLWPGVRDWTGQLTLDELAALLEQADVLVGADSGPAHLAAAVGTPVVVLFSGTNHPPQWQPRGEQVTVVRHPVQCSPCHRERCPLTDHPCMNLLRPQEVFAAVDALLSAVEERGQVHVFGQRSLSETTSTRRKMDPGTLRVPTDPIELSRKGIWP